MKLLFLVILLITSGLTNPVLAMDDPLKNYYNKEGTKVLRYLANGMQKCNQLATVNAISEIQHTNCTIKSNIASKKAKRVGVILSPEYFLSQGFLSGLATAINEETKFKRMLLSEPGAESLLRSREFNKLSSQYLEDFKNAKLR